MIRAAGRAASAAAVAYAVVLASGPAIATPDWIDVRYGDLVDVRQLSHSGEPVGALLTRLGGRPLPPPGGSIDDRTAHTLLEPLLEPYAFVLADALDTLEPATPLVELGRLWTSGATEPAWVELLRARRLVVASDGRGRMRAFLPLANEADATHPSAEAARAAYQAAWPVLRHVFTAELARLRRGGSSDPVVRVEARAYQHVLARTTFRLGRAPWVAEVRDGRPDGRRPPLDLSEIGAFFDAALELEGGRLASDGTLRLFGSRAPTRPTILGHPVGLGDLAVAYRAVFHGGLAEPYMSLDRGLSPQTSIVNYGGRLRDTSLGMVSLLCDMRFKTFSLGLDLPTGQDLRTRLRATVPGFRSHLERFAADPGSAGVLGQQTRLWFYPDTVDLTVSPESDVLALRRVRMAAASERVEGETTKAVGGDPPWTRATVADINQAYDGLAAYFPEMSDLDQVVRLLSLFTWLREAERGGRAIPDLDALLALDVAALPTPRMFPQMLAFNALPPPATTGEVVVHDRLVVGDALDRLNRSNGRPLAARARFERALAALDPQDPQMGALGAELAKIDPAAEDEITLDLLAYRAERLRMHEMVLSTLGVEKTEPLVRREQAGERLRVFSVGIGGLDLGMGQALARATGRSIGLAGDGTPQRVAAAAPTATTAPLGAATRPEWREEGPGVPVGRLPDHGVTSVGADAYVEPPPESGAGSFVVRVGESGMEVTHLRVALGADRRATRFERLEAQRWLSYTLEPEDGGLRARRAVEAPRSSPDVEPVDPPGGLLALQLVTNRAGGATGNVTVRSTFAGEDGPSSAATQVPRSVLARLVLGREVDPTPTSPMPFGVAPEAAGAVEARMVLADPAQRARPWADPVAALPGETDPLVVARALGVWDAGGPPVIVGTDPGKSPGRWAASPAPRGSAILVLPRDGFPGLAAPLRGRLAEAWSPGTVLDEVPEAVPAALVLVVSHEAPDAFAARLRAIARRPALRGKLLGAWCVSGALRDDLPAWILAESAIAGLGLGEATVLPSRGVEARIAAFGQALRASPDQSVEQLAGPFLWFY